MGGMMGGGGGKSGGGSGGASDFDLFAIQQAVGQNIDALQNRYKQLGIGEPSGDPLQAALKGTSLTYAGPSTMEQQDIAAQNQIGQAAVGSVQAANINNPFAPGSPANLATLAQQQSQLSGTLGNIAGFNAGGGSTGTGALPNPGGGGIRDTGTSAIG
jgi:hypothetical protein